MFWSVNLWNIWKIWKNPAAGQTMQFCSLPPQAFGGKTGPLYLASRLIHPAFACAQALITYRRKGAPAIRHLITKALLPIVICGIKHPEIRNKITGCVPHGPRGPEARMSSQLRDVFSSANGLSRLGKGVATLGFAALVAFGGMTGPTSQARAQDNAPIAINLPIQSQAVIDAARDYALKLEGIGVYIAVGDNFRGKSGTIVNVIKGAFRKKDVESDFFIDNLDQPGTTITYYAGKGKEGPFGITEAGQNVDKAITALQFYRSTAEAEPAPGAVQSLTLLDGPRG